MKKYLTLNLLLYGIIAVFLSSCSTEKNILFGYNNSKNSIDSAVYEFKKGEKNYKLAEQKIQAGDELKLMNLQSESLISGTNSTSTGASTGTITAGYIVELDSTVLLPVLGKVKLGGLTRENAETLINNLYQKTLLKNPLISLSIINLHVTLLGDFATQGNFLLKKDKTHITEMLGLAGGLNTTADNTNVKIIRGNPKNPQILIVNMSNTDFISDQRVFLQNNDIVFVTQKKSVQNAEKATKTISFVGIGLTLINTIFLIYNLSR